MSEVNQSLHTRFTSWWQSYEVINKGKMQIAQDAYSQGSSDFHAQRLRADTAEAERDGAKAANAVLREELRTERLRADAAVGDANEAERKLAAAEKSIAQLSGLLREGLEEFKEGDDWIDRVVAALNPNPECCKVSAEDQALLDAGEYTPEELFGIGGKPSCPKCFNPNPRGRKS